MTFIKLPIQLPIKKNGIFIPFFNVVNLFYLYGLSDKVKLICTS